MPFLCFFLLVPAWEVRHGAALGLRELLASQGGCAGVPGAPSQAAQPSPAQPSEARAATDTGAEAGSHGGSSAAPANAAPAVSIKREDAGQAARPELDLNAGALDLNVNAAVGGDVGTAFENGSGAMSQREASGVKRDEGVHSLGPERLVAAKEEPWKDESIAVKDERMGFAGVSVKQEPGGDGTGPKEEPAAHARVLVKQEPEGGRTVTGAADAEGPRVKEERHIEHLGGKEMEDPMSDLRSAESANERFLEECSIRLLCVLALDR